MRRLLLPCLLACFSLIAAGPGLAQSRTAGSGEAPEALFGLDIGDAEVDFYLAGSWQASLAGSLGLLVDPAGALSLQGFPGWEGTPVFRQIPDLTLSVWLMQRYFLEASVVGDFTEEGYDYFDQNYILAGYRAGEEEFLRQVLLGSRDIGIGAYPYIEVPAAGRSSLGASARMGTGLSSHELMLRFDNNEQDRIVFIGKNRVSEQTIALSGYQRGRLFRLPDAGVEGVRLYLEDPDGAYPDGEGRRYRLAGAEDAAVDAVSGAVTLQEPAAGAVLVHYTVGAAEVGDVSLGAGGLPGESGALIDPTTTGDFSWAASFLGQPMSGRQVTVDGRLCLRLYRPGEFSPFEVLGAYALDRPVPAELSRLRVTLVRKGSASLRPDDPPRARLTPGADYVAFEYPAGATRYRRESYPFLDAFDAAPELDPDNLLYGPGADAPPGYPDYEILASHLSPISDYLIGGDVVPGSVQVYRNGASETRFEVDYAQGLLTFLTEISPSDRLEVHFRRQLSLAGNGDLLFAWGNTLRTGEALNVQVAAGLRWNLLPGGFTEEAYTRTGSVVLSAGAEGRAGPLSYQASAGVSFTNPDTTGRMRLLGMEATGLEVPLSEDTAWPAAAPALVGTAARGELLYKDFRSYGALGSSALMPYTWSPPPEQVFEYETGSKPGPYNAAGSFEGDSSGRSLVLDLRLDDGEWVGAQLPLLPEPGVADLSSYRGISLRYRMVDFAGPGQCRLYVQLGEVGEDLDGDAVLDQESSASAAGFLFNDADNAALLRVGSGPKNTGNSRRDGEDVDGNRVLDPEAEPWIVTLSEAPTFAADSGWTLLQYPFSAAERERLRRTRSLRLIVVESGAGADTVSGRLLIDRLNLEGSPFAVSATGVEVTAREVEEAFLPAAPAQSLEEAFPEVSEVFHPFGERQKVLAVEWSGGAGLSSDSWQVKGYFGAPSEGIDYRDIVYYYCKPDGDGGSLSFALTDAAGQGVSWKLPAEATPGWVKVRVALEEGTVYRDGVEVAGHDLSGTLKGRSVAAFTVGLDSASAGRLYLDELHLGDPRGAFGAGGEVDLRLQLPGELLALGGRTLLRDLAVRTELAGGSGGFSGLYGAPPGEGRLSARTELGVGISRVDLNADLSVLAAGGDLELGGGHSLSLPLALLRFSDYFRLENRAEGPELSRGDSLSLRLPLLAVDLESTAGVLEDTLTQRWLARVALTPGPASLASRLELWEAEEGFVLPAPGGGYLANWLRSYALIAPWRRGEPLERKGNVELDWSLATAPVGLRAVGVYGFHSFDLQDLSRSLRSRLNLDLSAPLALSSRRAGGIALTPGYRRSLALRETQPGAGAFAGDVSASLQGLFDQRYAFAALPFAELYDAGSAESFDARTEGFSEAAFQAEGYLRLSRNASSRLTDLLVPSSLELALGRSLERAGELTTHAHLYTLRARSLALNLFGRLGAYPLLPLYRTDEFSAALSLSLRDVAGRLEEGELSVEHFAAFEGTGGRQLTIRNRCSGVYDRLWRLEDTLELLYTWERHPSQGVRLPLLPEAVGREGYWTHLEGLALAGQARLGGVLDAEEGSYRPLNLVLTHESALMLPGHGSLKASLATGLDLERTSESELYKRFGVRGGLELRLEF